MRTVQGDPDLLQRGDSVDGIDECGMRSEEDDTFSLMSMDDTNVRIVLNLLEQGVQRRMVFSGQCFRILKLIF